MKHSKTIPAFFIVGVHDFSFTKELESFLKEFPVSGLALFNSPFDHPLNIWKNPGAAMEAIYEFIVKASEHIGFFCADQEGGRVRRLRPPFIHLPSALQMTEVFKLVGSMQSIEEIYKLAAQQMALTGIHLNFAPVCDLKTGESNSVVGDRSYGKNSEEVLPFIKSFCDAFEGEGVHTTLKHFPGHGPTKLDSHEQIATVFKSKKEIWAEDRDIFVKASKSTSAMMTAHIAFEEDPERIFSLDPKLLREFKKDLPMDLVWITDDLLSMKAVSDKEPWLKALDCEYDFILLCGDLEKSSKAIEDSIRYSERSIKNFQQELEVEKRAKRSANIFRQKIELSRYLPWKQKILEIEKMGNDCLGKIEIKT